MPQSKTTCCIGAIIGGSAGWCIGWLLGLTAFPEFSNTTPDLVELSLAGVGILGGYSIGRWGLTTKVLNPCWDEEWVWQDEASSIPSTSERIESSPTTNADGPSDSVTKNVE